MTAESPPEAITPKGSSNAPSVSISHRESQRTEQTTSSTVEVVEATGTAATPVTVPTDSPTTTHISAVEKVQTAQLEVHQVQEILPAAQSDIPVLSPSTADQAGNGDSQISSATPGESIEPAALPTPDAKATASTTAPPRQSVQVGSMPKKQLSFFGRVKSLFHSDKEEKKERK
jgi:hypothetical protein